VHEHALVNKRGDVVTLLDYGARIRSIQIETVAGTRELVLGYPRSENYRDDRYYLGASIGRYCNRIGNAHFAIDGEAHPLVANEGANQLHGGPVGFDRRFWELEANADREAASYSLYSASGDQGFPGNVHASVRYSWTDERELQIRFAATTDSPTHVSLTNHAYFNLDPGVGVILDHKVRIDSRHILETDEQNIPTGNRSALEGTALNLLSVTSVRSILEARDPHVQRNNGADFNFVLGHDPVVAEVWSSTGDLRMTVQTTYPGLQFYTGQHLGAPFERYGGLCLEPQYYPDSPNQASFPSTLLLPGDVYDESIVFQFLEIE
jgi:aldose 1-epimerase